MFFFLVKQNFDFTWKRFYYSLANVGRSSQNMQTQNTETGKKHFPVRKHRNRNRNRNRKVNKRGKENTNRNAPWTGRAEKSARLKKGDTTWHTASLQSNINLMSNELETNSYFNRKLLSLLLILKLSIIKFFCKLLKEEKI